MAPCNGCYHNLKKAEYDHRTTIRASAASRRSAVAKSRARDLPGRPGRDHPCAGLGQGNDWRGRPERTCQELAQRHEGRQLLWLHVYAAASHLSRKRTADREANPLPNRISWMTCWKQPAPRMSSFLLKTACCGGAHTLSDSDTSTRLVANILHAAEASGAEVIATECPTCHSGLEMHQIRAEKRLGIKTNVKIIYFTQLLGMAHGPEATQSRYPRECFGFHRLPEGKGSGVRTAQQIGDRLEHLICHDRAAGRRRRASYARRGNPASTG